MDRNASKLKGPFGCPANPNWFIYSGRMNDYRSPRLQVVPTSNILAVWNICAFWQSGNQITN